MWPNGTRGKATSAQRSPQPPEIRRGVVRKGRGQAMRVARSGKGARCPLLNARKVQGDLCPTGATTSRNHNAPSAQGRRGTQCSLLEARKVPGALCPKLDKVLGASCPTRERYKAPSVQREPQPPATITPSVRKVGGSAKRIPTADPPVSGAGGPQARKAPRTRSASSGGQQPSKRQSRRERQRRGRLRAHGISGCLSFLTARSAESGFPAGNPRLWKIFPFAKPRQS